jgi:hypothetical protein
MKKCLFIMLAALGFVLTSCNQPQPEPCNFHKDFVDFVVRSNDWYYDAGQGWYVYTYSTPKITTYIYDYGTWTMSHEYYPGTSNEFLVQLPEIKYLEDVDAAGNVLGYYSQRIDYAVGVGFVEVYVTNSDYSYLPNWKPEEMAFHMQIVY